MTYKHIEWKSSYVLGVEDIDFQHHYFLNLINRLSEELEKSDDFTYLTSLIGELNAYVNFHFNSEENLMLRADYPGLEKHKKIHNDLLNQLTPKETMLDMFHSKKEIRDLIDFLVDWFIHHSTQEDRFFADYLHKKEQLRVKDT